MSNAHLSPRSSREVDGITYEPVDDDLLSEYPDHVLKEPPPDAEGVASEEMRMRELAESDLSQLLGPEGALARELYGYEMRPSQLAMAEAVKRAILAQSHALIEAPTGTGKSIAYLLPAILSGRTVVVSTANKSLQSQLFQKDIPFLRKVLGKPIPAVVVKGRSNFVCNLKWEKELAEQKYISLYDREDEQVKYMRGWLDETESGDVDELPFLLSGDLRPRVVSFPDDCLHGDCRYYDDACWVNRMRAEAAQAQVIITNHHLLLNALELGYAGERILPPASIYIVDEAHHLEQIATAVFEVAVSDYTVEQLLARNVFKEHVSEPDLDELRYLNSLAFQEIAELKRDNAFELEGDLEGVLKLASRLSKLAQQLKQTNPYTAAVEQAAREGVRPDEETAERNRYYELAIEALNSTATKFQAIGSSRKDTEVVRYAVRVFDRRRVSLEVHAAPVNPATLLGSYLFHPEEEGRAVARTVICTSATLSTDGHFAHFRARCGIRETGEEAVLPPVFDYPQQALLYQPPLPAYNYRNTDAYYDAVASEIERLLEVSRGRTLCLFTNWSGLQQVNDRLQAIDGGVIWPVRAQGDAPREALLAWFRETPYSVLLATRSFWEGVDIPGDDLSLVIMDKMPFPTPGDPLHGARMRAIEDEGRSSFDEYMVPLMTLSLKQGFGRLIRRSGDRGVVAILDERLSSKAYGRRARQDLPPARFTRLFKDVHRFYQDALATPAEFALNVWAMTGTSDPQWRWQLVRLQDGRAEMATGHGPSADHVHLELHAALQGLHDLQQRVERAGHSPKRYAVELRCSRATVEALESTVDHRELARQWAATSTHWRALHLIPIER
ncbi:MAG: ATP-dependent DNA helicase [Caldilineaceae bacterium]|nr:ATP-dependent DNA helicase [Caldilineaceae bacterium]